MSLPRREEVAAALREELKDADLTSVTVKGVRATLEERFGVSLVTVKDMVKEEITRFLAEGAEEEEDIKPMKKEEEAEEEAAAGGEAGGAAASDEERGGAESDEEEEKPKAKRKGGGRFNKPQQLSDELSALLGQERMSRPDVVRQLWVYIKGKDLQDPKDKRQIICDEALHAVFKSKRINMFSMNKKLSAHLKPPEDLVNPRDSEDDSDVENDSSDDGGTAAKRKRRGDGGKSGSKAHGSARSKGKGGGNRGRGCPRGRGGEDDTDGGDDDSSSESDDGDDEEEEEEETPKKSRKRKAPASAAVAGSPKTPAKKRKRAKAEDGEKKEINHKVHHLSGELSAVVGTNQLSRPQVVKQLWVYIRANELQNPNDKREILCDAKLKAVMGRDSVTMFSMNKFIGGHMNEVDA